MTKQYSNAASLSGKDLVGLPLVSRSCRVKILQKKKKKTHFFVSLNSVFHQIYDSNETKWKFEKMWKKQGLKGVGSTESRHC